MPPTALSSVPQTYAELRRAVELTMVRGQQAVEQAKVRTYWETGRLINEHVLLFKERADHGAGTIQRLASDLKVHRSVLQRCVQFAQAIPNCATWRNLTWAHYRVLIPVADSKERRALASEANRNAWPVARLEQRLRTLAPPPAAEVSTVAADSSTPARLLTPKRGTPGVCKVIAVGETIVADLGFACCTTKPDKYDRYLADVFLEGDSSQFPALSSQLRETPVFLNNALLAAGHATVKKEWEFSDWGV